MKLSRLTVAAVLALASARASAFHEGGVGRCEGCHTVHDATSTVRRGAAGAYLLKSADPSSVCLNCHGSASTLPYAVLTTATTPGFPPLNFTPGGDFAWIEKSYAWSDSHGSQSSTGERHGHNVVAADYGLEPDSTKLSAPGNGTGLGYPAASLSCISCHDPHGRYRITDTSGRIDQTGAPIVQSGSYGDTTLLQPSSGQALGVYRLLGGVGYAPKSVPNVLPFNANPPVALAPSTYNQGERAMDVRVAYGAGMSEWCANCHGTIHAVGGGGFEHPSGAGAKLGMTASMYDAYLKTGDLSNNVKTAYTSLVPYEEGTSDRSVLSRHARSDGSALDGPATGMENVMCLTCHRAHASGWDEALRWNVKADYVVFQGQWPGTDNSAPSAVSQGRTAAETRAAMYDRNPEAFAPFQRSLCNKCHVKD